ncbi:DUF2252 family protein [Glaciimonas sp. CA11.2]|uniref:DUF2252 domain-containing protein n=1 Tax=unclassified Glaciimonas TaxID=2644401 RepID=UPI002AB5178E|nr:MULTISPECIES: DUF2252 family protein [unclassified Glaciimonas]MDY7549217.1 DUF2252 family protein [Glaciimonas sp. CA11.2]MEB0013951.1 DUF2252 family protein [Glaciimonas sp. Cout2]MEB0083155.1 DUF2252 family protein [Glaciimonas sp. Gout2]MEB0161646.1 DUF2252 family protein [Glaciimonas sp. CA11.2]
MTKKNSPYSSVIIDAIQRNNAGREPERLAMKYAKMSQNPFIFLRGTCHLFYDALPDTPLFRDAPLAWCCGDLHFENFGSYKGDNRLVYFDINDYDEAALAPATWDMVRLLTSVQCGADALRATRAEALAVSQSCLDAYRSALITGKPLWVERETSSGLVNTLLTALQGRERAAFLNKRTISKGQRRSLKIDCVKALPASDSQKKTVIKFMDRYASSQQNPNFFQVLDVARRIAGTGSLGVERFVVLVNGKGSPDGNYLLDIKEAKPSALVPHLNRLGIKQPVWADEASRVVAIQKRMQAVDHAFLQPVKLAGLSCILKGLQPSEDRVAIGDWGKKLDRLKEVVSTMGRNLAWDQLRASGRSGAANADALIAFAQGDDWMQEMLDASLEMTHTTQQQWQTFVAWRSSNPTPAD